MRKPKLRLSSAQKKAIGDELNQMLNLSSQSLVEWG